MWNLLMSGNVNGELEFEYFGAAFIYIQIF